MQQAQGNVKEAIEAYGENLAVMRELAAKDPGNSVWQQSITLILTKVGDAQKQTGNGEDAIAAYRIAWIPGSEFAHDAEALVIGRVIGLVFAHRDAAAGLLGFGLEHYLRSAALGGPVGERDPAGHRQPMPVLHGSVAHIAELRLPPGGLAIKTALGIAGARMRVVLALLSVEIAPAIFVAAAVHGAEALVRGPRLDQRSVHRKMLVRQQWLDLRMVQKLGHEFGKHLAALQPLAVFVKVVGSQIGLSGESPTNQRYKRL